MSFSYVSLNGNLVPFSKAQVSLAHPVFTTSLGVYESIQVDQGHPFHLNDHIERLQASADLIGIPLPASEKLRRWGVALIQALPPTSCSVQILALGDSAQDTIVAFLPKAIRTYAKTLYTQGASAITYPGQRAIPQCKSFNTLVNHLARVKAHRQGALEGILTHNNQLYEGARSNVFVVIAGNNTLLTPPARQVLSGITRDIVLQVMEESPYPIQERRVLLDMPLTEMFITSTSMHVMPITTLNGQKVGNGQVGPVTREAMKRFEGYYEGYFKRVSR
jgi:branched-subunit amino acid aminotransferase/4-amino-4-deoxychorismate lyase